MTTGRINQVTIVWHDTRDATPAFPRRNEEETRSRLAGRPTNDAARKPHPCVSLIAVSRVLKKAQDLGGDFAEQPDPDAPCADQSPPLLPWPLCSLPRTLIVQSCVRPTTTTHAFRRTHRWCKLCSG